MLQFGTPRALLFKARGSLSRSVTDSENERHLTQFALDRNVRSATLPLNSTPQQRKPWSIRKRGDNNGTNESSCVWSNRDGRSDLRRDAVGPPVSYTHLRAHETRH